MTVCTHWREDAACRDADPDLFFPIGTTGAALGQIEEAKQMCRTCPAQVQCLAWALENGSPTAYGVAPSRTSGASSRAFRQQRPSVRKMMATRILTRQSTENMEDVRQLLSQNQRGFSAALELALELAELVFWPLQMPRETGGSTAHGR